MSQGQRSRSNVKSSKSRIQIKSQQFVTGRFLSCMLFRSSDLDFGPMTLKLKFDLDILKMYL